MNNVINNVIDLSSKITLSKINVIEITLLITLFILKNSF